MPKEQLDISIILTNAEKAANDLKKFADKTKTYSNRAVRALNVITASATRLRQRMLNLKTLMASGFILIGLKRLGDSFIDANDKAERFRLTLNSLLGSVEEGNKVFDEMTKFAAKVPFTFEEIMQSATQLAGVVDDGVEDITKLMPIITDLAAAYNLTMEQTTAQVVRLFSAGAASADLFRERGVNAMLGFQAGVKTSAEESKRILFAAWEAEDSKFRGIANDLADTWTGVVSMITDKWGQLMRRLGDLGLFGLLKDKLKEFDDAFRVFLDNNDEFFAQRIPIWVGNVETFGKTVFTWAVNVKNVIATIVKTYNSLPETVREWGIILAIVGGKKIRIALATLTALGTKFDWVASKMKNFANFFEGVFKTFKGEINFGDLVTMDSEELQTTLDGLANAEQATKDAAAAAKLAREEFRKLFTPIDEFAPTSNLFTALLPDPEELEMQLDEDAEIVTDWADVIYQESLKLETKIARLKEAAADDSNKWLLSFGNQLSNSLSSSLAEWDNFFDGVVAGFGRMLTQMAAELAAKAAVFGVLNVVSGGAFGGIVGGFKKFLGFADGGFTGAGGKNEIAGVVHKGEFVVPQSMLQQNAGMLQALQGMQSGGDSSSTTFNVNLSGSFGEGMTEGKMREMTRNVVIPELKEAKRSGLIGGTV